MRKPSLNSDQDAGLRVNHRSNRTFMPPAPTPTIPHLTVVISLVVTLWVGSVTYDNAGNDSRGLGSTIWLMKERVARGGENDWIPTVKKPVTNSMIPFFCINQIE